MERIDLTQPRFTQAQVLQLVPKLAAKDLQNWVQRGVIDVGNPLPGRQGKVLYTGAGVVALAIMARLTKLGIGPRAADAVADRAIDHAVMLHDKYPVASNSGYLSWIIVTEEASVYHRGYVFRHGDEHVMLIKNGELDFHLRLVLPDIYITIELDILLLSTFNRLYKLLAGLPPDMDSSGTEEPDARFEEFVRSMAEFGGPGGENA